MKRRRLTSVPSTLVIFLPWIRHGSGQVNLLCCSEASKLNQVCGITPPPPDDNVLLPKALAAILFMTFFLWVVTYK